MTTFTYIPDRSFKSKNTKNILKAKFGDGYVQRVSETINNTRIEWNLVFKNRDITDTDAIIAFIEATDGVDAFDWNPPGASQSVKVTCEAWDEQYIAEDIRTITLKFERVYEQ